MNSTEPYILIPRDSGATSVWRNVNHPISPGDDPYTPNEYLINELYEKIWGNKVNTYVE